MLTRYACTAAELSCVIGNIFAELSPPCAACGAVIRKVRRRNRYDRANAERTVHICKDRSGSGKNQRNST